MKYCNACGYALEEDTLFCPNCGARVERSSGEQDEDSYRESAYEDEESWSDPEDRPLKKKNKKKKRGGLRKGGLALVLTLGGVAVLAAAAVILFLTGSIVSLLPHSKSKLKMAEYNLYKQAAAVAETGVDTIEDLSMSYELTMDASLSKDSYYSSSTQQIIDIVKKMKVSGGIETGTDKLNFRSLVDYKDNEFIDLMLFLDKDRIGAYVSPVSEDYYTCSMNDLMRLAGMEDVDLNNKNAEKLRDNDLAKKDIENVMTIVVKHLFDSKIDIKTGKTVELFNEDTTVKGVAIYTITPSKKDWQNMLEDVYEALAKKGTYTYTALEYYVEMMSETNPYFRYDSVKDLLDDLDLKDNIEDLAEDLADEETTIEIVMKGSTIIRQRLYFGDADNKDDQVGYDFYENGGKSRFCVFVEDEIIFDFESSKNGSEFEATVNDGSEKFRLTGSNVKLNNRSTLNVPQGEYEFSYIYRKKTQLKVTMEVSPEDKGMNHEIVVKSDDMNPFSSISLKLYTEKGAKISKPKNVETVDIGDMSEKELMNLGEKLYTKFMNIVQKKFDF